MPEEQQAPIPGKPVTLDALRKMSPAARARLYENARRMKDRGGQGVIDMIEASGLPLSASGMTTEDPIYLEMQAIVWSREGRAACLEATELGLPALAGVEPMIRERLGGRYHPHDQGTMNAGYIVGELMRHLGYIDDRPGKMPKDAVAKTAMVWMRR